MSKPYSAERAHSINGVPGRLFPRHVRADNPAQFSAQLWKSEGRADRVIRSGYGPNAKIHAEIRFDDSCGNGRASFAITAELSNCTYARDNGSMGCAHGDIARAFPELQGLIQWHLFDHSGPMHYVANTCYLAGNRDHNGLLKGETRQIINGRTKLPAWRLEAVNDGAAIMDSDIAEKNAGRDSIPLYSIRTQMDCLPDELPAVPALRWVPWNQVGEGKERDLESARRVAVWPDATDDVEAQPDPVEALLARMDRLEAALATVSTPECVIHPFVGIPDPATLSGELNPKRTASHMRAIMAYLAMRKHRNDWQAIAEQNAARVDLYQRMANDLGIEAHQAKAKRRRAVLKARDLQTRLYAEHKLVERHADKRREAERNARDMSVKEQAERERANAAERQLADLKRKIADPSSPVRESDMLLLKSNAEAWQAKANAAIAEGERLKRVIVQNAGHIDTLATRIARAERMLREQDAVPVVRLVEPMAVAS